MEPSDNFQYAKSNSCPKTPVIVMAILSAISIGFGVFGMLSMFNAKNENKQDSEQENPVAEESKPTTVTGNASMIARISNLLRDTYNFGPIVNNTCSVGAFGGALNTGLDTNAMIGFVIQKERLLNHDLAESCGENCKQIPITYNNLNRFYKEYFAVSDNLEKRDYALNSNNYLFLNDNGMKYNQENDSFYFQFPDGVGCSYSSMGYFNTVFDVKSTGDNEYTAGIVSIYADFDKVHSVEELSERYSDFSNVDIFAEQYRDAINVGIYDFVFDDDNGELKIKDIKKVK